MALNLKAGGAARGLLYIGSSSAAAQIVGIIAVPLLARLYSPESFGVYAAIMAVVTIFSVVGPVRLDSGIQVASDGDASLMFFVSIATTLVAGVLCCIVLAFTGIVPGVAFSPGLCTFVLVLVVTAGLYAVLSNYVLRARRYGDVARRNFLRQVGTTGGQLGCAFGIMHSFGLLLGTAFGQLLGVLVFAGRGRELFEEARRAKWSWRRLRRYWRFPILFTPSALLNAVGVQIPLLFVARYFGHSAGGNLSQGLRIGAAPALVIGASFASVVVAEIATRVRSGERHQRVRFMKATKGLFAVGLLWFVALAFIAPSVLPWLLGRGWEDAGRFTQSIAVSSSASLMVAPLSAVLIVYERAFTTLILDIARIALTLGAGYFGLLAGWGAVETSGLIAGASALVYGTTWWICLYTVSR